MADNGIETATIELLFQAVQALSDEAVTEMAQVWRQIGDRALAAGIRLSDQRNALAGGWDGAAATTFDTRAARTSLSMYESANTAVANAAGLEMAAAAISTAQREMQALWNEYQAKFAKLSEDIQDLKPSPKAGTLDGGIDIGRLGDQAKDVAKGIGRLLGVTDDPGQKLTELQEEYNKRARAVMRPLMNTMQETTFQKLPAFDGPEVSPTSFKGINVAPPQTFGAPGGGVPPVAAAPGGGGGGKAPAPLPPGTTGRKGRQAAPPPPPAGAGVPPRAPGETPPGVTVPPAPGGAGKPGTQAGGPGAKTQVTGEGVHVPAVPGGGLGAAATGADAGANTVAPPAGVTVPPVPGGGLGAAATGADAGANTMAPPAGVTVPPLPAAGVGVGAAGGVGANSVTPPAQRATVPPVPGADARGTTVPLVPAKAPPPNAGAVPPIGRAGVTLPGASSGVSGAGVGSVSGQRATPPPPLGRGAAGSRPPVSRLGASPTPPGASIRPPSVSGSVPGGGLGRTSPGMGGSPPPGRPARRDDPSADRLGRPGSLPTEFDPVTGRPTGPDLTGRRGAYGPVTPSTGAQPALGGRRDAAPAPQQRPASPGGRSSAARARRPELEGDPSWSVAVPERPDLTGRPGTTMPATAPPSVTAKPVHGQAQRPGGTDKARERRKSANQLARALPDEAGANEEEIWELPEALPALVDAPRSEKLPHMPEASLPGTTVPSVR